MIGSPFDKPVTQITRPENAEFEVDERGGWKSLNELEPNVQVTSAYIFEHPFVVITSIFQDHNNSTQKLRWVFKISVKFTWVFKKSNKNKKMVLGYCKEQRKVEFLCMQIE